MKKKSFRNIREEIDLLFNSSVSAVEFTTKLSMMDRLPKEIKIFTQLVYAETGPRGIVSDYKIDCGSIDELKDGSIIVTIKKKYGRVKRKLYNIKIIATPSTQANIVRIIAICSNDEWVKICEPYINKRCRTISRLFYRQSELYSVLQKYEETLQNKIHMAVVELIIKEKRGISSSQTSKKVIYDSERKWTDQPIKFVFDDAAQREQWFKSIKLDLYRKGRKESSVSYLRLSRYGLLMQDYFYEDSINHSLPLLEAIAVNKVSLFVDRGLRQRNYIPANPLVITYNQDFFQEKKNVRELAKVISRLPNASKTIYHGNPYLHIGLADYRDGSSFEIWVLTSRRVLIIPQTKATVQSIERLSSHIFDNFREGEIGEYNYA